MTSREGIPGFTRSTLPSPEEGRISKPVGGGRRAPPAPAPSPTLPGEGRRAKPLSGRAPTWDLVSVRYKES
eukprot:6211812-Pleurochrysis_carterae.AAC.2